MVKECSEGATVSPWLGVGALDSSTLPVSLTPGLSHRARLPVWTPQVPCVKVAEVNCHLLSWRYSELGVHLGGGRGEGGAPCLVRRMSEQGHP